MMDDVAPAEDDADLARRIAAGDRTAVAAALNLIDDRRTSAQAHAGGVLDALPPAALTDSGHLIGITGPPGVGKSSLTGAMIRWWRQSGRRVGILAVDPSSPISGGALLGDRVRMLADATDDGVFIRSLANRQTYGGLATEVWPMAQIMLAAFDVVLIETVGVGQREVDVAYLADTTCYVAQPQAGDTIQFLKAGIVEVPQVIVVNKIDLGPDWETTFAGLEAVVAHPSADGWVPRLVGTSATTRRGIDLLGAALDEHRDWLATDDRLGRRRRDAQADWVIRHVKEEFGQRGIAVLGGEAVLRRELTGGGGSAFAQIDALGTRIAAGRG